MKKSLLAMIFGAMAVSTVKGQSFVPEFHNEKIKVKPAVPIQSYAFNLKDLRLLDGPFKRAAEGDARYLLSLEPDRLLYRFYENAGLPVKGAIYGGWESQGVSGHTLGHYLSACALQFASTGQQPFKERTDYLVAQLARCQEKRKTGYVGGIPDEDRIWKQVAAGDIRSQGFDLNGGWVPWYTVHKVLAGLLDVYLYTDNEQARTVATHLSDWVAGLISGLSDAQMEQMLACEHGGMNDALANMYAVSGNKKYLDAANRFYHRQVLDPLSRQKDELAGKHANTQIPKVIGCARIYEVSALQKDKSIADFFWQTVTSNHSYVIGGNSMDEHFGQPNQFNDRLEGNTTETCNTYNMLKLSRHLFAWNSLSKYNDYYERALYNHILASQNPDNGMVCYYVPLKMGGRKAFSTPFESFWCCVGTGMENHVKYAENIYARSRAGGLYVNLFIPSVLNWREKGITVTQRTRFPESDVIDLQIQTRQPQSFPVLIRHPEWAQSGVDIYINGQQQSVKKGADGYIVLDRKWGNNDQIRIVAKMNLYARSLPDNKNRIALLYGPVVLSGLLGKQLKDPLMGAPVLVSHQAHLLESTKPVQGQPLTFRTTGVGQPFDVTLQPFYKTNDQHYSIYWDLFTQQEWQQKKQSYEAEKKRLQELEARTVDFLSIGEMQPERDHNLEGEQTAAGTFGSRKWRHAENGGWFAFDMKVDSATGNELLVTYWGDDAGRRVFDIFVNDIKLATQTLNKNVPGKFFDIGYKLPRAATQKGTVKIRFQAHPGHMAGGVFGCRVIRN